MSTRVLIVERGHAQRPSFATALQKRYEVRTSRSGKEALTLAEIFQPHVVILDAISMRTPGHRICEQIRDRLLKTPLIHLHPGEKTSSENCADVTLFEPFTSRKLINVIERLISEAVAPQADEVLVCGPFTLNSAHRVLSYLGHDTTLTPKLAQLVAVFLRHPGQTLDRKQLMEEVWQTDYMGDTRTLDVHIRWFRAAIEANPSKPVLLKTVRGIGYRLDVPADMENPMTEGSIHIRL